MSSSSTSLYQAEAINVDEFVYSQPHPNKTGTITTIYMNYNKTRPKIQSPIMFCPFGISVMVDEKKKDAEPGYSIEMQLGAENQKLESFTAFLDRLDARVLADCKKNSESWMKKKLSDRMGKELFKPLVKKFFDKTTLSFSDKYPARCKFKIQRKNGRFTTRFFDHNRQPIDLNNMSLEEIKQYGKGNRCKVIFEIAGIWSGAKGFGVTLKADQIMFYPPQRLTGFGFVDDVEDELIFGSLAAAPEAEALVAPVAPVAEEEQTDDQPAQEQVNQEEEEEQCEPSPKEPTPPPSPPKPKLASTKASRAKKSGK